MDPIGPEDANVVYESSGSWTECSPARRIPGSKLVILEGAGHAVFIDEPEKFDQALGEFLRSASP